METNAKRIVDLAKLWQDRDRWHRGYDLAAYIKNERRLADEYRRKSDEKSRLYKGEDHAAARHQREFEARYREQAQQHTTNAEQARDELALLTAELNELINLLRDFDPALRRLVPPFDFAGSPPHDLTPWLQAMADIESAVATPKQPAVKTEGAISQGVFVYNGNRAENIPPAPWRLLEFMEDKSESDSEEAYQYAIEEHDKDSTPGAIKGMIYKANQALLEVRHPKQLSKPKGVRKIVWV